MTLMLNIREEIEKPKYYEVDLDLNFAKMTIYDESRLMA